MVLFRTWERLHVEQESLRKKLFSHWTASGASSTMTSKEYHKMLSDSDFCSDVLDEPLCYERILMFWRPKSCPMEIHYKLMQRFCYK